MKQEEINANNAIIAEFMGGQHQSDEYWYFKETPASYLRDQGSGSNVHELDLFYHCRWDWLMPVVSNIFEFYETCDKPWPALFISQLTIYADINMVYKGVIEFINWYNENIKP